MNLHFYKKTCLSKNIFKVILILTLYLFAIRYSFYSLEYLPCYNLKSLLLNYNEYLYYPIDIKLLTDIIFSSFLNGSITKLKVIINLKVSTDKKIKVVKLNVINKEIASSDTHLDVFNPFLYSSKTMALNE